MNLDFSKGIHTQSKPINTPPGYYRDAENMRTSGGSLRTEEGMKLLNVPADFIIWGSCPIGDETILLGEQAGKSIIGSLKNDNWTMEIGPRVNDVFGIFEETQVEGRKNWAGERLIYFSTPTGARAINLDTLDQNLPDFEFDKITSLFLEYDLPRTAYIGEKSSGAVPTGVYQFAVRLVTESLAATPFGLMSNVIDIVPTALTSERQAVEGAPPQTPTSKAIELSITNIDTTFKYIQLGIITYVGLANTPVVYESNLVAINNQRTIVYTYRGAADHKDTLPLEELIASGVSYSSGKFFTQKDGCLLIGAPSEAAQPPIDWYRVAAGITAKYTVKLIPYQEGLNFQYSNMDKVNSYNLKEVSVNPMDNGYKNPMTCYLYKTYRRDEVYVLTITPVFTSGALGPTIQVPANSSVATPATVTNPNNPNEGGLLGTYVSEETYADNTYPGISGTQGLRLHKFPDARQQPLIEGSVDNGTCNIRVLGIELSNIVLDPSEQVYAPQIAGFIIGRVNRRGNETQLAQGIVRPHTRTTYAGSQRPALSSMLGDGFATWYGDVKGSGVFQPSGPPVLNDFNFLAPDLIHGLYDINNGSHIKQHSVYKCRPYYNGFHTLHHDMNDFSAVQPFFKNVISGVPSATSSSLDVTPTLLDSTRVKIGPFGVAGAAKSDGGKTTKTFTRGSSTLAMCSSEGLFWFGSPEPIKYHIPSYPLYRAWDTMSYDKVSSRKTGLEALQSSGSTAFTTDFVLHTLVKQDTKQYGPLDQMTSMFVEYIPWQGFSGTATFFNGDTFINKYGLTVNDEAEFPWPVGDEGDNLRARPNSCNGIIYFWLESNNNYDYRHYIHPDTYSESSISGSAGSVPFFPVYKQLISASIPVGLLTMKAKNWQRPGYASQYNNQYSAQPNLKPYTTTPKEDVERRASLVNRIIYSAQAVQGEKSDSYRIFLPNNYYDVPQEFGELTDVYVLGELFASTNQVQWRLFFNTLATQVTSVGQVVLGTGGAFPRPGVPMTTVDGGYGGTSHWTHAVNTVLGRAFIDKKQGKMFIMRETLTDISNDLDEDYKLSIQGMDNRSLLVGVEPLRDRVFFRINNIMWSYYLPGNVFTSRHTYAPRYMFYHGPHLYLNNSNSLVGNKGTFKHSAGPTGLFFGVQHKASVTLVLNAEKSKSKYFSSAELMTKRTTESGVPLAFSTFENVECWNDERYSGFNKLIFKDDAFKQPGILEVLASKVKDSFRFSIPRDIVKDPNNSIFIPSNHLQTIGDTIPAEWLARMRGNYLVLKFTTDNTKGPLHLFDVVVEVSLNVR